MDSAARAELNNCMVRLADGDRTAFRPVFEALWPVLRGFIVRQLPPPDAEDVAQEALLKIFTRASEFDPGRDALSWALGIAAFEARTSLQRSARRREEFTPQFSWLIEADSPERTIVAKDLQAAAMEVLGTLKESDVEALLSAALERFPVIPRATLRKRVERALKRLKLAWRTRHGAE